MNPPQQLRKASQTAWGFNCANLVPVHAGQPFAGQSAQADFVPFQRRIDSLRREHSRNAKTPPGTFAPGGAFVALIRGDQPPITQTDGSVSQKQMVMPCAAVGQPSSAETQA